MWPPLFAERGGHIAGVLLYTEACAVLKPPPAQCHDGTHTPLSLSMKLCIYMNRVLLQN